MKLFRRSFLIGGLTAVLALGCRGFAFAEMSDAEKHHSASMNAKSGAAIYGERGGYKVLFLGNSITLHEPAAQLGWTNRCGMAASSPENDYVHWVIRGLERVYRRKVEAHVLNLAQFERNYKEYDLKEKLKAEVEFEPELIVLALGENVPVLTNRENAEAYGRAFERLIRLFQYNRRTPPTIIVRGVFWNNETKDEQMKAAAARTGVKFVKCDISKEEGMTAKGLFEHPGVQGHPGDRGMVEIARHILNALR